MNPTPLRQLQEEAQRLMGTEPPLELGSDFDTYIQHLAQQNPRIAKALDTHTRAEMISTSVEQSVAPFEEETRAAQKRDSRQGIFNALFRRRDNSGEWVTDKTKMKAYAALGLVSVGALGIYVSANAGKPENRAIAMKGFFNASTPPAASKAGDVSALDPQKLSAQARKSLEAQSNKEKQAASLVPPSSATPSNNVPIPENAPPPRYAGYVANSNPSYQTSSSSDNSTKARQRLAQSLRAYQAAQNQSRQAQNILSSQNGQAGRNGNTTPTPVLAQLTGRAAQVIQPIPIATTPMRIFVKPPMTPISRVLAYQAAPEMNLI